MGVTRDLVALFLGDTAIIAIGAGAWRRNHSSGAGRLFFLAMLAFGFWLTTNYFSIQSYELSIIDSLTRLTYVGGVWLMLAAWAFSYQFPIERKPTVAVKAAYLAIFSIGTIFSYSKLVLHHVSYQSQQLMLHTGTGYLLYGVLLAGLAIASVISLRRNYKQADLLQRNQIRYVAFGIAVSATISILFNVGLVPLLGPQWGSPLINLLVTLPIVIFIGYGLIRNRYTDIHRISSGLFTYLLCLLLVADWLLVTRSLLLTWYPNAELSRDAGWLISATIVIFLFQPVRRYIKLRADHLFNVGWYDSQELLNTMSSILAGELRLAPLLKSSVGELCSAMQITAGAVIIVNGKDTTEAQGFGSWKHHLASFDTQKLTKASTVILADELPEHNNLLADFNKHGIRAVVPLETRGQSVGYLLLGIKLHGDIFSPQDIAVLQILSSQLAVAIVSAQAFEQTSDFNEKLKEQVAAATNDLRKANEKLQIDDRMKTEFIILTSHNLRTPLSIVKGYISLLEDTKLDDSQKQLLASMKTGSERLSRFTEDLLAIDSIVSGHQLILEATSAEDILQPLFKEAAETASTKGLKFSANMNIEGVMLNANQLRLSGAIRNLLDNAFKFTETGSVTLSAEHHGDKLLIEVADTGIGIQPEELPHIFTQFHRATSVLKYDYDGEGIGLYLTNLVIKEHGGTIKVTSELGKGSTFAVTLPVQS